MSTAAKHVQRSHRSHRKKVDFSAFERNAVRNVVMKEQKQSLGQRIKTFFNKRGEDK